MLDIIQTVSMVIIAVIALYEFEPIKKIKLRWRESRDWQEIKNKVYCVSCSEHTIHDIRGCCDKCGDK